MRLLFIKIFLLICLYANSQAGYNVFYETEFSFPVIINGDSIKRPLTHSRLVFNDSSSFFYGFGTGKKDPMNKSKKYGSKVLQHSVVAFSNSDIYFTGVAYPPGTKKFFVLDTFNKNEWVFTGESKLILGFKCKKAFLTIRDSKATRSTDTTIVWFTDEIPRPFGPYNNRGLPGLVLETYFLVLQGEIRTTAIKVEKDNFIIAISPKIKIVLTKELKNSK